MASTTTAASACSCSDHSQFTVVVSMTVSTGAVATGTTIMTAA